MQPAESTFAAEDLGGKKTFFDESGLHLHVFLGAQDSWNVAGGLSSHGTLAGLVTGARCWQQLPESDLSAACRHMCLVGS